MINEKKNENEGFGEWQKRLDLSSVSHSFWFVLGNVLINYNQTDIHICVIIIFVCRLRSNYPISSSRLIEFLLFLEVCRVVFGFVLMSILWVGFCFVL